MGAEYLIIATAILGVVAVLLLLRSCFRQTERPYALPTLLFALATGFWAALGKAGPNLHLHFAIGLLVGAVIFGLHAWLIRTLIFRQASQQDQA